MRINVFGISNSNDNGNKIDISLFLQKPYLRTNFLKVILKKILTEKFNLELRIYLIL